MLGDALEAVAAHTWEHNVEELKREGQMPALKGQLESCLLRSRP